MIFHRLVNSCIWGSVITMKQYSHKKPYDKDSDTDSERVHRSDRSVLVESFVYKSVYSTVILYCRTIQSLE